jgi:hypothetical protein
MLNCLILSLHKQIALDGLDTEYFSMYQSSNIELQEIEDIYDKTITIFTNAFKHALLKYENLHRKISELITKYELYLDDETVGNLLPGFDMNLGFNDQAKHLEDSYCFLQERIIKLETSNSLNMNGWIAVRGISNDADDHLSA